MGLAVVAQRPRARAPVLRGPRARPLVLREGHRPQRRPPVLDGRLYLRAVLHAPALGRLDLAGACGGRRSALCERPRRSNADLLDGRNRSQHVRSVGGA